MEKFNLKKAALLATAGAALAASFAAAPAFAGEGMVERATIDADIGSITVISGGKVGWGPFSLQVGDRETQTDAAVIDAANGSAKDVNIKLKLRESINIGAKKRMASVYSGR